MWSSKFLFWDFFFFRQIVRDEPPMMVGGLFSPIPPQGSVPVDQSSTILHSVERLLHRPQFETDILMLFLVVTDCLSPPRCHGHLSGLDNIRFRVIMATKKHSSDSHVFHFNFPILVSLTIWHCESYLNLQSTNVFLYCYRKKYASSHYWRTVVRSITWRMWSLKKTNHVTSSWARPNK